MKKVFLILALLLPVLLTSVTMAQTTPIIGTATVSFVRDSNVTAYAANDAVMSKTKYRIPMFIKASDLPSYMGEITSCTAQTDTALPAYYSLWIVSDTAFGVQLPLDNAAFKTTPKIDSCVIPGGKVSFATSAIGTGAGVGSIQAKTFSPIPFNIYGKPGLGFIVTVDSACTPKFNQTTKFRLGFKFYR